MSEFRSVRAEPFTREEDERAALALVPLAKEIADFVRGKIPPDADFGVLLFAKPPAGQQEGRVIVVTSDRDRVACHAAQWVLSVINPDARKAIIDDFRNGKP
jgi:hypothetical protein